MKQNLIILEDLYLRMLRIRRFEETLLKMFSQGHLRGTVHTCIGQEACAVGVITALDLQRDTVSSNHRGHGHFLASQEDMRGILHEVMGLSSGICGGIGGSQHLHKTNFYSNGILGGMTPVTTGMALAQKFERRGGLSVVFSGDGGMAEGVIYESLNISALWRLPLLLVVEHNKIAQSTPWTLEHSGPIEERPVAFGVPTCSIDGNDVLLVRSTTQRIVKEMRQDPFPRCLVLHTTRLASHSKGDDTRDRQEIEDLKALDPIKQTELKLPKDRIIKMHEKINTEINTLLSELSIA